WDRASKAGDRLERDMLRLAGAEEKVAGSATRAASATQQFDREAGRLNGNLISQRYALYDVASTYGIIGAALLGASAYAVKAGADFERAFTDVQRTLNLDVSSSAIASIRQ